MAGQAYMDFGLPIAKLVVRYNLRGLLQARRKDGTPSTSRVRQGTRTLRLLPRGMRR